MSIVCPNCYHKDLRRSGVRFHDMMRLVRLQLPVRCLVCDHRHFESMFAVLRMGRAKRGEQSGEPVQG